ncbi:peptide cleavage/export ABC transporter [Lactococcus hircilactis]|uniref:Peptide cleavage/export ABC transporter n=1 Tax=Lactococcus hircilactis TaxID=1494462 RepID=A0A7X1Z726_9LACT|nr:peptide cleavage/export ABC transporter [Lactococcus hircilactis]MQW38344.1 peptide cleavage/export ABC transporter [Lactococcus hircilactis]
MKFKKKYYTPQLDERDCGVAALSMILKTYGTEKSLASLRLLAHTDMKGTTVRGIKKAAESLSFDARIVRAEMTIFDIPDMAYPFIAHVVMQEKYPHFYVVTGVKNDDVLIADPNPVAKIRRISKKEFAEEWSKIAILIAPAPDYKPIKDKTSSLTAFIPLLAKQKKLIANIILASLLVTIINIVASYYLQSIVDSYIPNALMNMLGIISVALIFTYLVQQILSFAQAFLLNVLGQRLAIDVVLSYIKHIFELPMSFFATRRTGEIISRFSDANSILNALASAIMSLFLDLTIVLLTGTVLGFQNLNLFLLVLVSIPLYIVVIFAFMKIFEKQNYDAMQANAILSSSIIEDINGIETIKALASEDSRYQKIDQEFVAYLKKTFKLQKNTAIQASLKAIIQLVLNVAVLWTGAVLVIHQKITLGQLITFNALLTSFTTPLTNIINLQTQIQQARVANNRLNEVYLVESEFGNNHAELIINDCTLQVDNVSYQYGMGRNTLSDISLTIHENEKVTLVGMSGSGKTTLVKLFVNFFEPTEGKVTIGGIDVQGFDKRQLRRLINYLPQEPYIFTGTILENLTLGASTDVSQEDIMRAVELSEIRYDIEKMSLGYQTALSSDATTLSGGQKQRIALARALLSPAKVLILDEATSNLDLITEKKILDSLFKLEKTIIFIAHRLSVAERSQHVIVIDKGQIIEEGSHEELLERQGFYAKLYEV